MTTSSSSDSGSSQLPKVRDLANQDRNRGTVKTFLSAMPKLNKSTAGGIQLSVAGLNIQPSNLVGKIKSGSAGAGRLLSKVHGQGSRLFSRHAPASVSFDKDEGDVCIVVPKSQAQNIPQHFRERTISRDDSTIDLRDVTDADLETELVLDSCGILATNAKQLQSPQVSFEEDNIFVEENVIPDTSQSKITRNEHGHVYEDNVKGDINSKTGDSLKPEHDDQTITASEYKSQRSASFTVGKVPDKDEFLQEDVWIRREDKNASCTQPPKSLHLGKNIVVDNSEADKILAKYSSPKKDKLSHPNMKTSVSDSAISSQMVTVTLENFGSDSPKSALEVDFELNSGLQKKLPNLLQSAKMPRKTHRIYDGLKQHIEKQLEDKMCCSTIILV